MTKNRIDLPDGLSSHFFLFHDIDAKTFSDRYLLARKSDPEATSPLATITVDPHDRTLFGRVTEDAAEPKVRSVLVFMHRFLRDFYGAKQMIIYPQALVNSGWLAGLVDEINTSALGESEALPEPVAILSDDYKFQRIRSAKVTKLSAFTQLIVDDTEQLKGLSLKTLDEIRTLIGDDFAKTMQQFFKQSGFIDEKVREYMDELEVGKGIRFYGANVKAYFLWHSASGQLAGVVRLLANRYVCDEIFSQSVMDKLSVGKTELLATLLYKITKTLEQTDELVIIAAKEEKSEDPNAVQQCYANCGFEEKPTNLLVCFSGPKKMLNDDKQEFDGAYQSMLSKEADTVVKASAARPSSLGFRKG